MISVLLVASGIFIHPFSYFKYFFMLSAGGVIFLAGMRAVYQNKFVGIVKKAPVFFFLAIYLALLVSIKHFVRFYSPDVQVSLVSGYAHVIGVLFAFFLIFGCTRRETDVFFASYSVFFTIIFFFTGRDTQLDAEYVCRTISLYGNPAILTVFAAVNLFISVIAFYRIKHKIRYFFLLSASLALVAVIYSVSRAILLGLAAAAILLAIRFFAKWIKKGIPPMNHLRSALFSCLFFLVSFSLFAVIYEPKPDNAIDNRAKNNAEQVTGAGESNGESNAGQSVNYILAFDRFNEENVSVNSSVENNFRLTIWAQYIKSLDQYVWFGSEVVHDKIYVEAAHLNYETHNCFLYMLYCYGIVGLVLFIYLVYKACWIPFHIKSKDPTYFLVFLCFVAFTVDSMFHAEPKHAIYWCVLAAACGYATQSTEIGYRTHEKNYICD